MDTQGLTLLLDVSHRGCEDVLPIGDELQLAAELLFPAFRVNIRDDSRSLNRRVDTTEDDVCSATYAVGRNLKSFLAIVLGRNAHCRHLIYVLAQTTGLHYLRQDGQNAGVVDTTAKMKHGRDAYRLTDLRETRPGILKHLGSQITMLTCSMGSTPSHQNQHIILDELLGQTDDAFVLSSACIVATHNGDSTLDLPVDDVLMQGNETLPISSAKHVAKVFMRETSHHILFETGYACLSPILIVVYCLLDDLLGDFQRTLFLKLNMERTLDLGFGRGGHNMCMVVLGHFHQSLEDALDIRHHQLNGSCQKRQLLMQGITGRRDTAPHPYLICRAANPCQGDSLGSLALRVLQHLRILRCINDQLRENLLMPINYDIDLIVLQDAQVRLAREGLGSPKENVGKIRAQHGATPTVRHTHADRMVHDVLGVLVGAGMRTMHGLHHFTVEAAGSDTEFIPEFLPLLGSTLHVCLIAILPPEVMQRGKSHLLRELQIILALSLDIEVTCDYPQFLRIFDLIILSFAARDSQQCHRNPPAVVGVSGRTTGSRPDVVPSGNRGQRSPADTGLLFLVLTGEATRSHEADLTTGPFCTDIAGLDFLGPREHCGDTLSISVFE